LLGYFFDELWQIEYGIDVGVCVGITEVVFESFVSLFELRILILIHNIIKRVVYGNKLFGYYQDICIIKT